jgi:hypothetical protein
MTLNGSECFIKNWVILWSDMCCFNVVDKGHVACMLPGLPKVDALSCSGFPFLCRGWFVLQVFI